MQMTAMRSQELSVFEQFECASYRYKVFCKKLGWHIDGFDNNDKLELDQFDRPDTVYIFARNEFNEICGHARLLPTVKPYLISEVFPRLLNGVEIPRSESVWELSRFAATDTSGRGMSFDPKVSKDLLHEAVRYVRRKGATCLISASPVGVERLIHRAGYKAYRAAPPILIDNRPIIACWIEL